MKKKNPNLSNIIFGIFIVLLIVPQTRTPIQVAVNKVKLLIWSPSVEDEEDQTQLQPFSYQVTDLEDSVKSIEIGKGKVTFISYWATWCPPCIAELPSIQKLYADYGKKIDFLLVTNENPAIVGKFLKKNAYDVPVYFSQMKTPELLYNKSIPTNYIIDQNGKIIIKETGAANWNSKKVREVLEGLLNQ